MSELWVDEGDGLRPVSNGDLVRLKDLGGTKTLELIPDNGTNAATLKSNNGDLRLVDGLGNIVLVKNILDDMAAIVITESQISDLGAYITSLAMDGLTDVVITAITDGELIVYDQASGNYINKTLAEAGIAAAVHTHAAGDIASGTLANARIAQSNVTQHQAAIVITESQISDLGAYITSLAMDGLTDVVITAITDGELIVYDQASGTYINKTLAEAGIAAAVHTHAAGDIASGTLANARIAQSNVTQHQAAIVITESQISDLGAYIANVVEDITPQLGGELDCGAHSIGFTLLDVTGTSIDWRNGNKAKKDLTANVTLTFTAPSKPGNFILKLVQDATGGRTVTWPASVKWAGGTAPTLSPAGNAVDVIALFFDGTNYYGVASLNFS